MEADEAGGGTGNPVLTPALLAEFWPEARGRLVARLRSRGADAATAEEAVAEAAARALTRRLHVTDIDDFCRWAYVVARNVVTDSGREAANRDLVADVPEQADAYDLAHHIESREEWRRTQAAIASLPTHDQAALLAVLEPQARQMTRQESVHEAVRRHRARARLNRALRRVGGWLPWLRHPVSMSRIGRSRWSEALALLLPPLVALGNGGTTGSGVPVPPMQLAAPLPGGAAHDSIEPSLRPIARTGNLVGDGEPSAPSTAEPPTETSPDPASYAALEFTVSPAYNEDRTVFATGGERPCRMPGGCPVLLRSTDGGSTWTRLPAVGRDFGSILLAPAYPRDPRIFSASPATLSVSTDGGSTFRPLATVTGFGSMSPLFSDGDPRILFGGEQLMGVPTAMQYVDGEPAPRPLVLPLPADAVPLHFVFSNGYAEDNRTLVTTVDVPRLLDPTTRDFAPSVKQTNVYSCDNDSCHRVIDVGQAGSNVISTWTARRGTVMVAGPQSLHRSVDGGRTFVPVALPGAARSVYREALVAAPDGRVFLSVADAKTRLSKLYVSNDDGSTWHLVGEEPASFARLVVLPDGALLEGRLAVDGGIRCSVDGGSTWARSCRR